MQQKLPSIVGRLGGRAVVLRASSRVVLFNGRQSSNNPNGKKKNIEHLEEGQQHLKPKQTKYKTQQKLPSIVGRLWGRAAVLHANSRVLPENVAN